MNQVLANKYFIRCVGRTLRPLLRGWQLLREISGDDAYERYLTHHAASHPGLTALSPKEYFVRRQLQKWNGIKRCC